MNYFDRIQKRHLLRFLAAWPVTQTFGAESDSEAAQQRRFKNIGIVLVTDAVAGAEMGGVMIFDDRGTELYGSSLVSRKVREIRSYSPIRVPPSVRVLWRIDPKAVWSRGSIDFEGEIAGDYTVPVASRIPDAILEDIRAQGGALRLKFRLKPDGVMLGWDIQRKSPRGDVSIFESPGGDFLETRY